jgi:hypothetical protein
MFPQRWNKYSYVQNDPLGSIDPDGLEDYKVFLAAPQAGGNWDKAAAIAKANGHTLQVFKGKDASIANPALIPHPAMRDSGTDWANLFSRLWRSHQCQFRSFRSR